MAKVLCVVCGNRKDVVDVPLYRLSAGIPLDGVCRSCLRAKPGCSSIWNDRILHEKIEAQRFEVFFSNSYGDLDALFPSVAPSE